jgi:nitrogen regulatory protein P-II 1
MREVKTISRPQRLGTVTEAPLDISWLSGVTVSNVHAYAGSRHDIARVRHDRREADFTKLETVVSVELVDRVVAAISRAAHIGQSGDGIVFVLPVDHCTRIRDVVPPAGDTASVD